MKRTVSIELLQNEAGEWFHKMGAPFDPDPTGPYPTRGAAIREAVGAARWAGETFVVQGYTHG